MGKVDSSLCSFCKVTSETIVHILCSCNKSKLLWQKIQNWCKPVLSLRELSPEIVIFGLFDAREYILFSPLCNITISLKSIRPNKTEIKIIAEKIYCKCLHPGSNLQLAPPCDDCSNALPTELPPLLRNYLSNFVNYRKQIKYCGNSIEIFPF